MEKKVSYSYEKKYTVSDTYSCLVNKRGGGKGGDYYKPGVTI